MDQVRIGIIGLGSMGSGHVRHINSLNNCRLTAVCDLNPDKLQNGNLKEDVKKFTDNDEFFAYDGYDAVVIAVPHYQHVELAIRAMEEGKHVLVEKPVSVQKKTALQLLDAVKKHPELKVATMFNQRTLPAHIKIKKLLESGELGKIRRISWTITNWFRTQAYYDSGDWRATWGGEGGGVLLNQCPHQLDLMQWFFGMPERVTSIASIGKYHDIEVEDEVTAILEYPEGYTGVFITTTGECPGSNRLEIACDRGRLILEDDKLSYIRCETLVSDYIKEAKVAFGSPEQWKVELPVGEPAMWQHTAVIHAFAEAILHGTPLVAEAVEGINGLELGNAMLLSGLKHKTVTLPIDVDEFDELLSGLVATSKWGKKEVKKAALGDFSKSF